MVSSHSWPTARFPFVTTNDQYNRELRTNSLLKILDNLEEPAIIEWHPTKPLIACTSLDTGSIQIFGIEAAQKCMSVFSLMYSYPHSLVSTVG